MTLDALGLSVELPPEPGLPDLETVATDPTATLFAGVLQALQVAPPPVAPAGPAATPETSVAAVPNVSAFRPAPVAVPPLWEGPLAPRPLPSTLPARESGQQQPLTSATAAPKDGETSSSPLPLSLTPLRVVPERGSTAAPAPVAEESRPAAVVVPPLWEGSLTPMPLPLPLPARESVPQQPTATPGDSRASSSPLPLSLTPLRVVPERGSTAAPAPVAEAVTAVEAVAVPSLWEGSLTPMPLPLPATESGPQQPTAATTPAPEDVETSSSPLPLSLTPLRVVPERGSTAAPTLVAEDVPAPTVAVPPLWEGPLAPMPLPLPARESGQQPPTSVTAEREDGETSSSPLPLSLTPLRVVPDRGSTAAPAPVADDVPAPAVAVPSLWEGSLTPRPLPLPLPAGEIGKQPTAAATAAPVDGPTASSPRRLPGTRTLSLTPLRVVPESGSTAAPVPAPPQAVTPEAPAPPAPTLPARVTPATPAATTAPQQPEAAALPASLSEQPVTPRLTRAGRLTALSAPAAAPLPDPAPARHVTPSSVSRPSPEAPAEEPETPRETSLPQVAALTDSAPRITPRALAAPEAVAALTTAPPPEPPRLQELRVTLTPAELGEVTLVVRHEAEDRVQATIIAASAPAQQALQHLEPQVRAALAQQGLQMSGLDVSTGGQGASGQSGWQPPQFPSPPALPQPRYAAPARPPVPTREASRATVDLYA